MVGQRMPSLSSVTFGIQLAAGIKDEHEAQSGLASLLAEVLFQGTEQRTVRQLTEDFEAIGARKGGEASTEFARYTCQVVHHTFGPALDLMSEVVRHPAFPEDGFRQMRDVQLQEIRRRDDEPMRRIFDLVRERFYAGTHLGRVALGTRESVSALVPDDLRTFWRARYQPDGALFVIAGNFDWDDAVRRVEMLLGEWTGAPPAAAPERPNPERGVAIEQQEGTQEHIGMAFPFPAYGDPDYYAALVVSEIFGGGMTSRLFREVREKRGLVYSVASIFAPNGAYGAMFIYGGTTPEKAHETVEVILDQLRELFAHGITEDELTRAKVQLKSELVMRGESSSARMASLARSWWFERRLTTIQQVKEAVDAVSRAQIQHLLDRFPPDERLVLAAIGPRTRDELIGDALG
jgi:predicted Zn-dependent peptidase